MDTHTHIHTHRHTHAYTHTHTHTHTHTYTHLNNTSTVVLGLMETITTMSECRIECLPGKLLSCAVFSHTLFQSWGRAEREAGSSRLCVWCHRQASWGGFPQNFLSAASNYLFANVCMRRWSKDFPQNSLWMTPNHLFANVCMRRWSKDFP